MDYEDVLRMYPRIPEFTESVVNAKTTLLYIEQALSLSAGTLSRARSRQRTIGERMADRISAHIGCPLLSVFEWTPESAYLLGEFESGRRAEVRGPHGRFWAKVVISEGCWEWAASLGSTGYGQIMVDDAPMKASRYSWILAHGPIPDGLGVCHKCDNRRCVRPDHLFLGTQKDNAEDMARKFRGTGKLTREQVLFIREAFSAGVKQTELAEKLGISLGLVHGVVKGKVYRHV